MARPLRVEFENALYHVMSRGNERKPIVRTDDDRFRRLERLRETVEMHGWLVHAFCLMTNHDHLFLQTPEPNLSAGMQQLNASYASWFNRRHRRQGHLFQGRFKAQLVEEEGHYLEISRYIHLNPYRARMVERPEHYRWSSYQGYHRADCALPWVTYDAVLREFGRNKSQARARYRQFIRAGMDDPPASPFANAVHGLIIGGDAFVDRIVERVSNLQETAEVPTLRQLQQRPSLQAIVQAVCETFDVAPETWRAGTRTNDLSRAAAAWLARRRYGHRAGETATALGYRSASSVSATLKRVASLRGGEKRELHRKIESIERRLGR